MTPNEGSIPERRLGRVIASPRARRAMRERGVDPASIRGTGSGGRIVEADVRAAWCSLPTAPRGGPTVCRGAEETFGRASAGAGDPRRALFWLQATADVTSLLEIQRQIAEEVQRACGTPLRLADLLLRAIALALVDCPAANRVWQDAACVEHKTADVGFEVDGPGRRVTAVIRGANRVRLLELVRRRAELTAAAGAGRLPPEAACAAAASLCDLSDYPIERYAAVLLPSLTSVLTVGRPALRPWEFENRVCLRQTLYVSLTADERAMSPETAAAFLGRIVELLEHPFLLLCERLPR